jgi:hypothetical protein
MFLSTPTYVDNLKFIVRNPLTNRWELPVLVFNPRVNPYYGEIDSINEDRNYQRKVIRHFYNVLKEKWLFKKPLFRSLLKYFVIEKKNNEGKVSLINNMSEIKKNNVSDEDTKYIFKYIEKYILKKRFIKKILREYVATTHIKWYDLYTNSDTLQELFCHKLKKLIKSIIYDVSKKK